MGFSEAAINIEKYFKEHLPSYEVVEARRKSGHVEDAHLFMVAARKDFGDLETCHKIMDDPYHGKR